MAHSLKFNTLHFANKLKEAGMDSKQAEVLAELQAEVAEDTSTGHATTGDLEILESKINSKISALETKISALEATIIKWVIGISFAQTALIVSLVKFVH